jgi:hypothetical protein
MTRATTWVLIVSLFGLVWFSHRLAGIRVYQVDECENVNVARILSSGHQNDSYSFLSLLHFPLGWVDHGAASAVDLFVAGRFLMLEIFWLNMLLIAVGTGQKLFTAGGVVALAGAATLAPLWDYGFEIRHDNLLLSGLLLFWCVARVRPSGLQSYVLCGVLAVALQFVAFKAFVYTVPLSLAILLFPPPSQNSVRWKLALGWIAGALATFLLMRIAYGRAGLWDLFLSDFHRVADDTSNNRFAPWPALVRLFLQTPLLLTLAFAAMLVEGADILRRRKVNLNWEGNLPEAFLCLIALGALLINPTPFPYNVVNIVPFAYLLAFRYAEHLWRNILPRPAMVPVVLSVLVFTHLVPFALATSRHLQWTNFRQEQLMCLAESLTDSEADPVYDGIGMVPTRPSVHFWWFLHSFNISQFTKGPGPRVRDMLAARSAAVIIPSYRTDWLTEEDHAFIRQRYLPVADDFWVLGKSLPGGGGTFQIYHRGRYRISTLKGSDLADTYELGLKGIMAPEDPGTLEGTLDGQPLSNKPVELCEGIHRIECASDCQPAVVWMGPKLDRIHRIGPGDHRQLFVNWY